MALYLNISQPMGGSLGWEDGKRLDELDGIFSELIRQLNFLLGNLGAENVIEAASVKAENIDTTNAKIVNAQIKNLTASKIKAGTLDLSKGIVISNRSDGNGTFVLKSDGMALYDGNGTLRFTVSSDETGNFGFGLYDENGDATIVLLDNGSARFTGTVESSEIYASHIAGVGKDIYDTLIIPDEGDYNGIFVDIGHKGMKIFQEKADGETGQKFGTTVDSEGTVFLILGEGNNENVATFNGVRLSDEMFVISKASGATNMELRGMNSGIQFAQNRIYFNTEKLVINYNAYVATEQYVDDAIRQHEQTYHAGGA